ncbi:MFS transporter [Maribellus comscasis]|uniref:MFS transporter n=1 Tax=Maribellus comscasis TaxID=2681766 RepID=A0A6I6JJV2_9BACT|nr:peptide MFS transporter [Maribellus comscasis]QGY43135.1 MFS transporter [Maribellus comscasis]
MGKQKKHPKGLMVLFFTEMWERFGFYLLIGIFFLYMTESKDSQFPGMGFSGVKASDIYGSYLALVYLTPFIGGLLADRYLGYRLSITIGGLLFSAGYFGLAINNETAFFVSLLLIIMGNGLFKPNISALVGKIYDSNPKYRDLKDSGYNIFYMGINIGAFICNFIAAYLRINYGWGWAFAAAGVGMLIGVIWFWTGQFFTDNIKMVDKVSPPTKDDMPMKKILYTLFLPAAVAGTIGWMIPGNIFSSDSTDAFIFFSLVVVIFYFNIYRTADKKEKQPIKALLAVFGSVIVFWAIFHQNGAALTVWAENYTNRQVPELLEEPIKTLSLNQVVTTDMREVEQTDLHGAPVLDAFGHPVTELKPDPYFDNLPKENWPETGKVNLISTELFQSINPGFIILFTPLVVGFFNFLARKRKKGPVTTPAKIGWGMVITALSAVVMILAVIVSKNGAVKASAGWLFGTYAVITVGELCLSPMGLSLVSKLSPPRITALMMGGWFLSTSIGNKLSGVLSGMWQTYDNKAFFFLTNALLAMVSVILIFSMLPWLNRVMKEYTEKK